MSNIYCASCGTRNRSTAKFCIQCGAQTEPLVSGSSSSTPLVQQNKTQRKRAGKLQRQQPRSSAAGSVPRDHSTTLTYHKPLTDLSPDEALAWIQDLRNRLSQKMRRERAYLDRRAQRGTHTPTDDAYEADQVLEQEIMGLLEAVEQNINDAFEDEMLHQVLQRRPAQEEAHGSL